jgi:hypothetical protein
MAKFSTAQLMRINRKSKPKGHTPEEDGGELNIIPFLDIIMNILLFVLGSIVTIFTASIPVPLQGPNPNPTPPTGQRLNITVKITNQGFIVGASGGFLLPGCRTIGAANVVVPNRAQEDADHDRHDYAGLTECLRQVRSQWATETADEHNIQLSPNGDIPYRITVHTIDAVREEQPGACVLEEQGRARNYSDPKCMFPDVTLGVLRN